MAVKADWVDGNSFTAAAANAVAADLNAVRGIVAPAPSGTDDTTALQAVFDAALATPHKTVTLQAGTYYISAPLVYGSGFQLIGLGQDVSIIENLLANSDTLMITPSSYGRTGVTIRSLTFDQRADHYDSGGDSESSPLLDVSGTVNAMVFDVGIRNARTAGIYADVTAGNSTDGLKVIGCHVWQANGDGITVFGDMDGVDIRFNLVEHCKDDGIALQNKSGVGYPVNARVTQNVVRDCTVQTSFGATPRGILLHGCDQVVVDHNTIINTYASGIQAGGGDGRTGTYYTISNNTISGAGTGNDPAGSTRGNGIFLINADHVTVTDNTISGSMNEPYFAEVDCTNVTHTGDVLVARGNAPRVRTSTSSAAPYTNTDCFDARGLTAQAEAVTSFTDNLTGTPVDGQRLHIFVTGTAGRTITWGSKFENGIVALPSGTTSTQRLDVFFVWNAVSQKWRCVAAGSA